jgi:hypothetical protein
MQNKNNIENDAFVEMIKNRLENAQAPIDEGLWTEIEQRMQKKRRVIPFWLWTTLGGVAAIAFIVLTLRPFGNFTPNNKEVIEAISHNKDIQPDTTYISTKHSDITSSQKNPTASVSNSIDNYKSVKKNVVIPTNKNLEISNKEITNGEVENTSTDSKKQLENAESSLEKETGLALNSKIENSTGTNDIKDNSEKPVVRGEKPETKRYDQLKDYQLDKDKVYEAPKHISEKPILAASFGTGNGAEFGSFGNMESAPVFESIVNAETKYSRIMAAADFTTTTYLPPVSFGLKVSKEFAKNWSVESGLVYTYMSSLYKDALYQNIKADLNLHYLGIPVNVICNIAHNKKWSIYISGGGMIEKGLRSIYNQRSFVGNYEYTTVAKTKIEGIQLSVSGATGFSYLVYNDIAIYAEPSITYYFKNNQPMSARTDQPLIVGFNAGLRFRL